MNILTANLVAQHVRVLGRRQEPVAKGAGSARPLVWIFNVVGTLDLLAAGDALRRFRGSHGKEGAMGKLKSQAA